MNVEAENAVYRERARIKAEVIALGDKGEFFEKEGKIDVMLSRNKVLAIISNQMPNNGKI